MKVQVLTTVGISNSEMKMQYCRKARKAVDMLVGKTVYLEPGIHEVAEAQAAELVAAGLAVAVDAEPEVADAEPEVVDAEPEVVDAEPEVVDVEPKKKGKGKKPEALDLGLD